MIEPLCIQPFYATRIAVRRVLCIALLMIAAAVTIPFVAMALTINVASLFLIAQELMR